MFMALGAAASAIDMLSSIQESLSTSAKKTAGAKRGLGTQDAFMLASTNSLASRQAVATGVTSRSGVGIAPGTMQALFQAQSEAAGASQTPAVASNPMSLLYGRLDADHDGKITKNEFEAALGGNGQLARAGAVFAKMDSDADGSVTQDEMAAALKGHRSNHYV